MASMDMMEATADGVLFLYGPPVLGPHRAAESPASPAAVEVAREERAATLAAHPPDGALLITIGVLLLHGPALNGPPQVLGPPPPAASLARAEVERAARAATRLPLRLAGAFLMVTTPGWADGPDPPSGSEAPAAGRPQAVESLARVVVDIKITCDSN